jgi:hypothetical protein
MALPAALALLPSLALAGNSEHHARKGYKLTVHKGAWLVAQSDGYSGLIKLDQVRRLRQRPGDVHQLQILRDGKGWQDFGLPDSSVSVYHGMEPNIEVRELDSMRTVRDRIADFRRSGNDWSHSLPTFLERVKVEPAETRPPKPTRVAIPNAPNAAFRWYAEGSRSPDGSLLLAQVRGLRYMREQRQMQYLNEAGDWANLGAPGAKIELEGEHRHAVFATDTMESLAERIASREDEPAIGETYETTNVTVE